MILLPDFLDHGDEHFDEAGELFQNINMAGGEPDNKKTKVSTSDMSSLSSKQFLDQLVVPQLLPALNAVSTSRPADPIQFLAEYLIKHKKTPEETANESN